MQVMKYLRNIYELIKSIFIKIKVKTSMSDIDPFFEKVKERIY